MRVCASGDISLEEFDRWLLSLGDGTAPVVKETDLIELPEDLCSVIDKDDEKKSMKEFCSEIFPNLDQNIGNEEWLDGRAILAPTNREVDKINELMVDKMSGELISLHSSDNVDNNRDVLRYNVEYINTLNPSRLPASHIMLKRGMPVMLMRNLNPKDGLCNGTRLIFKHMISHRLLVCRTVGQDVNRDVYIPRITLRPKEKQYPFEWSRRQFPIRAAFSITINKAQGQTMKMVGVWLPDPVFSHGQLYVGSGRVGAPQKLRFAVKQDGERRNCTRNVVYREVLNLTEEVPEHTSCDTDEAADPIEVHEIQEYEGPYDGHPYDLRPRQRRTCSPARRAAPPRYVV